MGVASVKSDGKFGGFRRGAGTFLFLPPTSRGGGTAKRVEGGLPPPWFSWWARPVEAAQGLRTAHR